MAADERGAQAERKRHVISAGVIGGMVTGTVLAVFFVPVFFVAVRSAFIGRRIRDEALVGHPSLET